MQGSTICNSARLPFFLLASFVAVSSPHVAAGKDATPTASGAVAQPSGENLESLEPRIAKLIRQLGDPQYPLRQGAQDELRRIGPDAFDALTAAEDDSDFEVSSRAKYLVQLIRIEWARDTDSPQVKKLLENYEFHDDVARFVKLKQLAGLPGEMGLPALCRMARFEKSPLLSKHAALLVIGQSDISSKQWPARAKIIQTTLASSTRPGVRWLRAYLRLDHDREAALADWEKLIADEAAAFDGTPADAQKEIVLDVQRRLVEVLERKIERRDLALSLLRRLIALESGNLDSLRQVVDLLVRQKAWDVVDEAAKRSAPAFNSNAFLLYSSAQARHALGKATEGDEIAQRAFQLAPDNASQHLRAAHRLQSWGRYEWSEREYRHVIAVAPEQEGLQARRLFSEMLHDLEKDLPAAEQMRDLAEALKGEKAQKLGGIPDVKSIRSRMHFFYACHHLAQNYLAEHRKQLDVGIMHDPTDADVLIGLYRALTDDTARRAIALEMIGKAANTFREVITQEPNDEHAYNQYAWLIGNTEGDFDLALQYSHKSLELEPETASFLDTLAHCYAAKKDYVNAVKYQSRAAELEPHTMQITRALAKFTAELERSRNENP